MATSAQKQASAARRAKNRARGLARGYLRVRARPILRGGRYKITRRCVGRLFLFSPGYKPAELTNFLGYCLAYAATRY
ncbi:hypothetical protein, partial [Enhygromyxa salina]|uniref:hypothetical protein n=1 Tax=Enhygromyxa salina TaxID=215803 RepID=UPI0011B26248